VHRSRNLCLQLPRILAYQRVLQESIRVAPFPEPVCELSDGLGNRLYDFTVTAGHTYFEVTLDLLLEIHARTWGEGCADIQTAQVLQKDLRKPENLEAAAYMYPSVNVVWNDAIHIITNPLRKAQLGPHGCAQRIMEQIFSEWVFKSGVTNLHTSVNDLLIRKEGVCQDFSHLMIAALRDLGIPARYVSGYIETLPKPGMLKLVGADVSHAWVQAYDPLAGWKDFDPTNNLIPSEQHITIAFGRDFTDISPLRGLVSGGGRQTMMVSVDVAAVG